MADSHRRSIAGPLALAAPIVVAAGVYLGERRAVARWSEADERYREEPRTLIGQECMIDSVDGVRLRVIEYGDGPTVVLAHGFTAVAEQWSPVAARLRDQGFRVVAYDQRGHGQSSSGNGRFRPTDLGNDLVEVLRATAPDGAVLAGHSMGGIGIQAMLADHVAMRTQISAVVLVATLARPVEVPFGKLIARIGGSTLARRAMSHRLHGRVLARAGVGAEPANIVLDVIRDGWAVCPNSTRSGVLRDLLNFDFSEALTTIELPVTVVAGDLDQVTPYAENKRIAELLPNGRLETLIGVGHAAHWEAADRVAETIADYAAAT